MKQIFSYIFTSLRTTPFIGRTIVVLSFFFLIIKLILLFFSYGTLFQETNSSLTIANYLRYFVSDFLVCIVILWLVAINALVKNILLKLLNNIIICWIFLLFVLDIFTMYFFHSRISLFDIKQFVTPSLEDFFWLVISSIVVLCILIILTFFIVQSKNFKKNQRLLLGIYFVLFAFGCFWVGMYTPGGFKGLPDNILSINLSAIIDQMNEVSDTHIPDIYEKFFGKKKGLGQQPNIIVLFAESLSPIDSLRVGGVYDNLPYFDMIQKQWITFTNFINNWCTSDTAHIALLLWIEPIKLFGYSVGAYSWYKSFTESLPNFFNKQGYSSIFVSSVDINFLGQKNFLQNIGFSQIMGEDAFSGEKHYVFGAAPDQSLYTKALSIINTQTWSYFLVLQNISFHKPYNTPYGKTEADALRYADKSLYYFYLQLKKSWFFDNGILVIVSDHRKMEGLQKWEKDALGEFWYTKWLATVIGTGIVTGSINSNIIQHTDFFYSLKYLISKGLVNVSKIFNNIFSTNNKRNRWIVYCRYFQKNNKYTIVKPSWWVVFNNLSDISMTHRFIYKYLSSYITFQQWSWTMATGNNIVIIAHQWSPIDTPENSFEGFQLAKKNWAQWVEMDVSYTKDKQLVVVHGEQMWATQSCQKKKIGNYTLAYIQEHCPLKNGEPIRTLEDMLKSIDGMFDYYFIDIKVYDNKDAEQQVNDAIAVVQKLWMQDRVILSSYNRTVNYILWSHTNIIAARDTFDINDLSAISHVNHQYFMTPYINITGSLIQEVEDIGKKFVTYTVNTTGDLEQLYHQWVRMVMTDNVPLLKNWADRYLWE